MLVHPGNVNFKVKNFKFLFICLMQDFQAQYKMFVLPEWN